MSARTYLARPYGSGRRRGFVLVLVALLAATPAPAPAQTPAEAAKMLDAPGSATAGGIYTVESSIHFNVLDSVFFDPASGELALIGHRDDSFSQDSIPYLQYLATLLESPQPEFSLEWTQDSLTRVDAMLARELTQQESDAQAARLGKMVDSSGLVSHSGALMLSALGVYPINGDRAPGDLGVDVQSIGGGRVIVTKVKPGSAADKAGLKPTDSIVSVQSGRPVFYDSEFQRQVRFAGAGSTIEVTYQRDGQSQTTTATLDAAADQDPWHGVNRYDLLAMMYRGAGDQKAASVVESLGVFTAIITQKIETTGWLSYRDFMHSLGLDADFQHIQDVSRDKAPSCQDQYNLALRMSQQLDSIFHFAGDPLETQFVSTVNRTHDPASAMSSIFSEFDTELEPKVGELIDGLTSRPGVGFQIPPELVEAEYNIHPEMTPRYIGVPPNSQLARLMFAGDYLGKQLTNRQDLTDRVPGYQTQIAYQINHPQIDHRDSSAYRIWLSVGGVDAAQSADGMVLALKDARMRYNIRQTDDQAHDLANQQPDGYEAVLTGLYGALEHRFSILHEVREAAKLAAVARWMQQRSPGIRLPAEGRASWKGPDQVDGLIYIYLTTNQQHQAKVIKIAEGGLSFALPAGSSDTLFPVDASVVDLRPTPAGIAAFARPAEFVSASPASSASSSYQASWVVPVGGSAGEEAVVLEPASPNRLNSTPVTVAATSRGETGVFGDKIPSPHPDLGAEPAAGPLTVNTVAEQLASTANSGTDAATGPHSLEGMSTQAGCGFDSITCAKPVNAPPPPRTPGADALVRKVGAAGNDPAIKNSIAWYQKLEIRQADIQGRLDAVQVQIDKKSGDPAVLIAQKATLQNELGQNTSDETTVVAQVKARMVDLGVQWVDAPAEPPVPATTPAKPPAPATRPAPAASAGDSATAHPRR